MLKGLLWVLLLLVVWGLFRSRQKMAAPDRATQRDGQASAAMVCCAACHTYLPADEAYRQDGNVFCSAEHYRQWQQGR